MKKIIKVKKAKNVEGRSLRRKAARKASHPEKLGLTPLQVYEAKNLAAVQGYDKA